MDRRVVVEIDLKALVRNYRRIAAHVKPAKVLCVLKANAYGLGVAPFARARRGGLPQLRGGRAVRGDGAR